MTAKLTRNEWLLTKAKAILRRGAPSLRNLVFARLGYWPVALMQGHWLETLPVYCINLERAEWRRNIVSKQVSSMGLKNFHFVEAVDSRRLNEHSVCEEALYDPARSRLWHKNGLSLNEIACSLSHAECYRRIVHAGHKMALVIEDDALFRCSRLSKLTLEEIPQWADIIFLNAFLTESSPKDHIGGMLYSDVSYNGSAAGYLLTLECATRLLSEAIPVVHAADGLLGRALRDNGDTTHAFRGKGSSLGLRGVVVYPEAITNGSTEHFTRSTIR